MTCSRLEETSAAFDDPSADRKHAESCDDCRAFLCDAVRLRGILRRPGYEPAPRRRLAPVLVPAAIVLCLVLFLFLRPKPIEDDGPFAGLDGGGRAAITVKP